MNSTEAALSQIKAMARGDVCAAAFAQACAFVASVGQAGVLGFALAALAARGALDWPLIMLWLALAALRLALGAAGEILSAIAATRAKQKARRHIAKTALAGRAPGREAGLVAAVNDDIEAVGGYISRYEPLRLALPFGMAAALAFAFSQSWLAGAILLITGPLTPLFMALVGHRAQGEARAKLDALQDMSRHFLGRLRVLETIRAFGAEQREAARMARLANAHRAASVGVLRIAFLSSATIDFFATLSIALAATYVGLALLGLMPFSTGETITVGEGFAALLIAPEFFSPLRRFALAYHDRADARAASERLAPFFEDAPGVPHPADAAAPRTGAGRGAMRLESLQVGFGDGAVSAPISAVLAPGGLVAVWGASGAGKSALLHTLAGFLAPIAGRLELGEGDRSSLLVAQAPFLFPGDVRENLGFGLKDANPLKMERALCDVGLARGEEDARLLLGRRVSDVATGVSGGEARRIAIARALMHDAPVLLLDEPTAHLDYDSERQLITLLARLAKERIVIAATHSPRLRAAAEQIIEVRPA